MNAIRVENLGIRFKIFHRKQTTLREEFVRLLNRKVRRNAERGRGWELFWALRNVSFEVEKGETIGVIGRNGSGKSTLLTALAGVYAPDEGTVETHGRILPLLRLGTGFHGQLSGRENIYLYGAFLGMKQKEIDAVFDSIVEFAEIGRFLDTPMRGYSSGMRSKLGFAVAVHVDPAILLLDEIMAAGDLTFRQKSQNKIYEMKEKGKTIVYVSHALAEVRTFCDRVLVLERGRLVHTGEPHEAIEYWKENVLHMERDALQEENVPAG